MLTFVSLIRAALQGSVSLLRLLFNITPPIDRHILYPQLVTQNGVSVISPYYMCKRFCIVILFVAGMSYSICAV